MCRHGTSVRLLALLVVLAAPGVPGCGQKGPLYLPDEGEKEAQETALSGHPQVFPGATA
jgi:predicted small lipoprotein YifL